MPETKTATVETPATSPVIVLSDEVTWFPGKDESAPAIGGLHITISLADPGAISGAGLGWDGSLTLICSVDSGDDASIPTSAWTPTAIVGTLPLNAPCTHQADTWKIHVDPNPGEPFTIEPVYIVGLPGSHGFPPVGHH